MQVIVGNESSLHLIKNEPENEDNVGDKKEK
jgi:hypothetical protein